MPNITEIENDKNPNRSLNDLLNTLHQEGPINSRVIENLSYYKIFHPHIFKEYEEKILSALGLFYKNTTPDNLYSFILSKIGEEYNKIFGAYLTPIQASIRNAINSQQYISISAPTSTGKSFSIREYIYEIDSDIVIIVPSRALIAEYIKAMKNKFKNDKHVMILPFVDYIFTSRNLRRIFILTPERARELFTYNPTPNISLFFFDEAQISEEKERGVKFDVLIRRIERSFPNAKLIFAHPFVDNPEAQISKHSFDSNKAYTKAYPHNTVGKIFVYTHKNKKDYYFSPFIEKGHIQKNCIELDYSFKEFAFSGKKSVLIFVSKLSLYNGKYIENFRNFIDNFEKITDSYALDIISKVEKLIGANNKEHRSDLVDLLRKGVVIHHGSVPLEVRFLVEDFIRTGFAKICFATSTLAQGINMPFDVVWLDNMHMGIGDTQEQYALAFKNLIGRSGRLSKDPVFDFGYVYTANPRLLSRRLNTPVLLSEKSIIDINIYDKSDDRELINSILEGTFDDEVNLPKSKIERLSNNEAINKIKIIINTLYTEKFAFELSGSENRENRESVKNALKYIYEISLNRNLHEGELAIFNSAIEILFHVMQGRSFKEIVGIRYNRASRRDNNRVGQADFLQRASKLPDSNLKKAFPLFKEGTKAKNVSYDIVVFDTYDYLDTVISYSLSDIFCGAFLNYYKLTNDDRSLKIIDLFKYGTFNSEHVLLIRYGFPTESVAELSKYIVSVSEKNILFKPLKDEIPPNIQELIEWYLP